MTSQPIVSAREAEVLALVGEHLSNAEIGARLFISVRTVESHVSALLRKLGVADRWALARYAEPTGPAAGAALPSPLTTFLGREAEVAALTEALARHRLVTAVGPGGVGKTRLALAAASATSFEDGVWFVDLVPVSDAGQVVAAVATAAGIGEQQGNDLLGSVLAVLATSRALLVLDNCEHVRDGVAPLVERVLRACPGVTVLATSRARLMVPYEQVYSVPPLPPQTAIALFRERAAAVGAPVLAADDGKAARICAALDGIPLAVELAAARLPLLGFDGLAAGLDDQLRLLTGGSRSDERHRSVRAMLDWGYRLLGPDDQDLLRAVSVFVAPFGAAAAAEVGGRPLVEVVDGLARLAEQSLLTVVPASTGTRYRALETIRQYGAERLDQAAETDEIRSRHLAWCLTRAAGLAETRQRADVAWRTDARERADVAWRADARERVDVAWRAEFDDVADELRAALSWRPDHRLALLLAESAFSRNLVGESQQRYEQAAASAADPRDRAAALRRAAEVAGCRMAGDDMYRLHRAAADAARTAGDDAAAGYDLATAVITVYRYSGMFVEPRPPGEAAALLDTARELAGNDPAAAAAIAVAECGVLGDAFGSDQGEPRITVAETVALAERAVEIARLSGDPVAESTALDALTGAQCWAGDTFGTADSARRRVALLTGVPVTPAIAHERLDALAMASDTSVGVGDLAGALASAAELRDLPLLAEQGQFALTRLMVAGAIAGEVDDVLVAAGLFEEAWQRAGAPRAQSWGMAAAAVAMVHGLRGDDEARAHWLGFLDRLGVDFALWGAGFWPTFEALVHLHHGRAADALALLPSGPGELSSWTMWMWGHWYVALRAEASLLAGDPDAADRIGEAREYVRGNPIATAIVERADALRTGAPLPGLAAEFGSHGCRYQRARTLAFLDPSATDPAYAPFVVPEISLAARRLR